MDNVSLDLLYVARRSLRPSDKLASCGGGDHHSPTPLDLTLYIILPPPPFCQVQNCVFLGNCAIWPEGCIDGRGVNCPPIIVRST